jgi:hypothetical protein
MRAAGLSVLAAAGVFAPALLASAGLDAREKLTAGEQRRLESGELVERRLVREQGDLRLIGGTSYQVIDADIDVVWRAVLDTQYYTRTLPQVKEARVIEDRGATRTIFLRHASGLVDTSYCLQLALDPARYELTFRLDETRPHSLGAAFGFYSLRPYRQGRTLMAYGVMADLGDGLGSLIFRGSVHEWLMKVPFMMKRFIEGSGRYVYRR